MWSNPRQGLLLTAERLDLGDVKEEIVVGKACGGKPGRQPWKPGDTAESREGVEPSP